MTFANAEEPGTVQISFVEEATARPIACRLELVGPNGRPLRLKGHLQRGPWTLIENGELVYEGKSGDYRFRVWHGPQFPSGSGGFTLEKDGQGAEVVKLPRHADLRAEGWLGGDLLAFSTPRETQRWLAAEELDMAVCMSRNSTKLSDAEIVKDESGAIPSRNGKGTKSNESENAAWVEQHSYIDDRVGSGLALHHWLPPADVPAWAASCRLMQMAKQQPDTHIEIQKMWARDVPLWLATGKVDSIQLLSNHLTWDGKGGVQASEMYNPDPPRFRGARGPGRLVEYLYWQVLEAGLRIAPSAGSGFGRLDSPLGYNRVYAFVEKNLESKQWWQALREGRTFVTNGPLLRPTVNGQLPGYEFQIPDGETLELNIGLTLTVSDPVEYLDVILNGKTLYQARLDEYARQGARIPSQSIKESGWLVIRVVTEREHSYRFATSAPYYFVVGDRPRASRSAIELFQQWLHQSATQIAKLDERSASGALPFVQAASDFGQARLAEATVP